MPNNYGDPVWLAAVLRAEGLRCDEYDGCYDRGHGDFWSIWGIVAHHTGASGSPGPGAIANHPELGLASQLHLARDGLFTVCGVGIAWHAGAGSWPGIPDDDANSCTIGIEAENNGSEGWTDAQYDAYVRGCGAILRHMGYHSDRVIAHREWAGPSQGKWDPGLIDMPTFRAQTQTVIVEGSHAVATSPELPEILRQQTGSMEVGKFPGWETRRHSHPGDGPRAKFTDLDFAREIDREVNSRLPVNLEDRPLPLDEPDTLFGQVLSLRAEVAEIASALRATRAALSKLLPGVD